MEFQLSEKQRQELIHDIQRFFREERGEEIGVIRAARRVLETGVDLMGDDAAELAEWIGDWKPDRFDLDASKRIFDR